MTARVQDDLVALAEKGRRYKEVDGGYTKAQVDVEVTDTAVAGYSATLQFTERTRLYLPFTTQEVADGAPEYEELSVPHTVKFSQNSDGAWLLSSDKAETEGGPTPTTQVSDVDAADGTSDGGGKADEDEGRQAGGQEQLQLRKMVAYADKYWDRHNRDYRTYGTDCTNFVSQALRPAAGSPGVPSLGRPVTNSGSTDRRR
ncbi:amidase domain-containing protein [Streptomyces chartreusis]